MKFIEFLGDPEGIRRVEVGSTSYFFMKWYIDKDGTRRINNCWLTGRFTNPIK